MSASVFAVGLLLLLDKDPALGAGLSASKKLSAYGCGLDEDGEDNRFERQAAH